MNLALSLARGIDAATTFIGRTVSWLILVAVLVSAYNAMARYMGDSLPASLPIPRASNALLELQWYLYGAVFLLAAAYTFKANNHIRIDVFSNTLQKSTRDKIDLFGHIFFLMPFCLLMIYLCWPWFWLSYNSGEISGNANGLILWPAKLMILFGFILLMAQAISEAIKRYAIIKGIIEDDTPQPGHGPAVDIEPEFETITETDKA